MFITWTPKRINWMFIVLLTIFVLQVLSELPSPVTSGTVLTVEDLQQELSCKINVKHRFVFTSLALV